VLTVMNVSIARAGLILQPAFIISEAFMSGKLVVVLLKIALRLWAYIYSLCPHSTATTEGKTLY